MAGRRMGRARALVVVVALGLVASTVFALEASAEDAPPFGGVAPGSAPAAPTPAVVIDGRGIAAGMAQPDPEAASQPLNRAADLPEPEVAEVEVGDEPTPAGDTEVSVEAPGEAPAGEEPPESVAVEVLDEDVAEDVGVSGFVFTVDRTDDVADEAEVGVTVDYEAFRTAFGGDYAERLVIIEYPACVVEQPEDPECSSGRILETENDLDAGTLTADLTAAPDVSGEEPDAGSTTTTSTTTVPEPTTTTVPEESTSTTTTEPTTSTVPNLVKPRTAAAAAAGASGGSVYAVSSGVAGSTGTYAATSLAQDQRWSAGGSAGDMGYSLPIDAPPASVGPAPSLSLDYSSGAVDGMTPGANAQAGDVGLGWNLGGVGFIERRYRACSEDGTGWIIGDLCWHSDNATISLNGVASELVRTSTAGVWRLENDPGWKVERRTDGLNSDNNDEYWIVTTPDGVRYFFGYGAERGSGDPTNSAWTVPVFGNNAGEPCYNATSTAAWCTQAWRWNLDRVEDTDGNMMTVFWNAQTNRYARHLVPGNSTSYVRGGAVSRIDYGMASGTQTPVGSVLFSNSPRCTNSFSGGTCPAMTVANASAFPDVPVDLVCTSTTSCDDYSPSFFSTTRIASIFTQTFSAFEGNRTSMVDEYRLTQTMPASPDGDPSKLWLDRVQRYGDPSFPLYGYVGGNQTSPPVDFDATWLANRADYDLSAGVTQNRLPRVSLIREELGGETRFTYGQPGHPCADKDGPWNDNDQYCFPVYYKPTGQPAGWAANNKWVLTKIVASDPIGASSGASSLDQTTTISYVDAPAWHHTDDPVMPSTAQTWSDYRGHSKVKVNAGNTSSFTRYFRGMNGDKLTGTTTKAVSITTTTGSVATDHDWLAGMVRETIAYDSSGNELNGSTHGQWWDTTTPTDANGHQARMVREDTVDGRITKSGANIATRTTTTFNSDGLATKIADSGDLANAADDRCTALTYATNTALWIRDRVARTTIDGNCISPYNQVTDTFYDEHPGLNDAPTEGHPTKVRRYLGSSPNYLLDDSPTGAVSETTQYDGYGRVWKTTTANNTTAVPTTAETKYIPDDATKTRYVTVTNPQGYLVKTTLSLQRGYAGQIIDRNGKVTKIAQDDLGRTTSVLLPGDDPANPSYRFTYDIAHWSQSRVKSSRHRGGGAYLDAWEYVDGFGRTRETQTPAATGTGRVVTTTSYDNLGRTQTQSAPFVVTGAIDSGRANPASLPNYTTAAYDELSRPTVAFTFGAGTLQTVATTAYDGFTTTSTSPETRKRSQTADARGNVTSIRQYKFDGSLYATTTYGFTIDDLLTSITDDAGNVTSYGYDHLGRRTSASDPDAGSSTYAYDNDGNLTTTTDAKGQSLYTKVDNLDRPVSRHSGTSAAGPVLAAWTYYETGSNKGLPATSTTYDDTDDDGTADAYESTTSSYDALERPLTQTATIPAAAGSGLAGTYTTATSYDAMGSPATITYPAVPGLPAEQVTQSYTSTERPNALTSPMGTYIESTGYRSDGLLESRTYGTGTNKVRRTIGYDNATLRLATVAGTFDGGATFQSDAYTHSADGNVASITDNSPGAGSQRQCFEYDSQSRLFDAWTSNNADDCRGIAGADPSTGSDPYQQHWTFDQLDNITTSTTTLAATTTNRTYHYDQTGHAGPHAATSVTKTGTLTDTYTYDQNGAQSAKTVQTSDGTSTTTASTDLTWNSDHRLTKTTKGVTSTTSSVYSSTGDRILRTTPDGTRTLYIAGHELTRSPAGTVTASRYYSAAGTTLAIRTATTLHWLLNDTQATADIAVAAGTTTVSRQRHLPYGEPRNGDNNLPTEHDYLGKIKDDTTGLVLLGARYYDPELQQFIGTDPLIDPRNPRSLNAYSYAVHNPTTYTDPTGLRPDLDGCGANMCGQDHAAHGDDTAHQIKETVESTQSEFISTNLATEAMYGYVTEEYELFQEWRGKCGDMKAYCGGAAALSIGMTIADATEIKDRLCSAETLWGCSMGEVRHDALADFLLIDLPISLLSGGLSSPFQKAAGTAAEELTMREIVETTAQSQANRGTSFLKGMMSEAQREAYEAAPKKGSRYLGTMVHEATAEALEANYPGRYLYRTAGIDFVDKVTGEMVELTTVGEVVSHQARGGSYSAVEYAIYALLT